MVYHFGKKEKLLSFGEYPTVTLEDARERRENAKRLPSYPFGVHTICRLYGEAEKAVLAKKQYNGVLLPAFFKGTVLWLATRIQHWRLVMVNNLEEALAVAQKSGRGFGLGYVPEEFKTPEVCLAAVQNDGEALEYVPEELKTPELCLIAVQKYRQALRHVPEKLKTAELCLLAVQSDVGGPGIAYVPEALQTEELCLLAIRNDCLAFQDIPEKLKTAEICEAAINKDWSYSLLAYVPAALRTEELCLAAVERNGKALEDVPEHLKTPELCWAVVRQISEVLQRVLQHVPKKLKAGILAALQ